MALPIGPAVIAAIISGATSLAKAYGNKKANDESARAAQKAIGYQRDKERILNDWYNKNYNEDFTQRADAQQLLSYTADQIKQRNKAAAGTAAVMGGTDESVVAEKEANNKAMADAVSKIAAAGSNRKDQIDSTYMEGMMGQKDKMSDIETERAKQIAKAGSALGGLNIDVASIVKAFAGDGGSSE
jgi:hypothetical protein